MFDRPRKFHSLQVGMICREFREVESILKIIIYDNSKPGFPFDQYMIMNSAKRGLFLQ